MFMANNTIKRLFLNSLNSGILKVALIFFASVFWIKQK